MKFAILLDILFELLSKRKITASYLAEKHNLSTRTIYRYITLLSEFVPVYVKRGRNGGVCLADNYKLPVGFMTQTEYDAAIDALMQAYADTSDERFLIARRKLSVQQKTELHDTIFSEDVNSVVIDSRYGGDLRSMIQKLRILEECIRDKRVVEMKQRLPSGEQTHDKIEPHVLIFRDGVWYVYAFCHKPRSFATFALGNLFSLLKTDERFRKRPFKREDFLLPEKECERITARFEISPNALLQAQEWFGAENMHRHKNVWIAEVALPNDEITLGRIVSFGSNIKVLSPPLLKEQIAQRAKALLALYEN